MTVRWRAEALADIVQLVGHISQEDPTAARKMGRELLLAGDSLVLFPHRGRRGVDPSTRELVTVWPYIIIYQIDEAANVTILNVWHGARKRP